MYIGAETYVRMNGVLTDCRSSRNNEVRGAEGLPVGGASCSGMAHLSLRGSTMYRA